MSVLSEGYGFNKRPKSKVQMNKKLFYLLFIFVLYWFGPNILSGVFLGYPIDEGLIRFAGNGFYYIGRDLDFYLEGFPFSSLTSIWLMKPLAEVLPEVLPLILIGIMQFLCFFLLKLKFNNEKIDSYHLFQDTKSRADSLRLSLLMALISGILLFSIELIFYFYNQTDFIFENVIRVDKSTYLLFKHPIYAFTFVFVGCIGAAIFEEYFFRKILFSILRRKYSFWVAAILSTSLFCFAHGSGIFLWVQTFYCGFVCCVIYERTQSIYGSILFHFLGNFFIFIIPLFYPLSSYP